MIPACILSAAAEKHCAPASPSANSMYADNAETRKDLPFFLLIQIDAFRNLRVPSLLYQPKRGAITSSRCQGSRVIDSPALSPFVNLQNVSMNLQTRSTLSCFQTYPGRYSGRLFSGAFMRLRVVFFLTADFAAFFRGINQPR